MKELGIYQEAKEIIDDAFRKFGDIEERLELIKEENGKAKEEMREKLESV